MNFKALFNVMLKKLGVTGVKVIEPDVPLEAGLFLEHKSALTINSALFFKIANSLSVVRFMDLSFFSGGEKMNLSSAKGRRPTRSGSLIK